ncbi:DUF1707 domain-containing protein [Catenulispora sp. NF23]|uniref:DUF1707 domain-containing protein n=1 Tax=Catenulispora pinistramenti TaxID=2705254 RepID=A0ABS5L1S9_9ACTN|nr:DUF1707 domain-containing protein [Catenulispora pinistramenti]MBS2538664.1 DUF1707 domain-containing protein [Catenulispora pinistramenti]MBS2552297.1 DUF1707 domain-containing protein [Catenulispora pinistramenti]
MTTQGGASFDPEMRAGDADRERLVEQLREHHAAGRLTLEEFDERMTKAYDAKTYGELRALTRDLPVDLADPSLGQGARPTTPPGGMPHPGGMRHPAGMPPRGPGQRPFELRRDESGRMQINIDNQVISDRINEHFDRHNQRWQRGLERREQRWSQQQERWQQKAAARRGHHHHGIASFSTWLSMAVLLTGIWLVGNLAGGDNWGEFWPAWPLGIFGALMIARNINRRD